MRKEAVMRNIDKFIENKLIIKIINKFSTVSYTVSQ